MRFSRVIGLFLVSSLLLSGLPILAKACDPLGCLVNGKDQDLLALVTITQVEQDHVLALVEHTYQRSSFFPKREIKIQQSNEGDWGLRSAELDQHYFISLACSNDLCKTKWGAWQVNSSNFKTAKLLQIRHGDDAAIQWLMNGHGSDFYGEGDKMFARTPQGTYEIYPQYPSGIAFEETSTEKSTSFLATVFTSILYLSLAACIGIGVYAIFLKYAKQ